MGRQTVLIIGSLLFHFRTGVLQRTAGTASSRTARRSGPAVALHQSPAAVVTGSAVALHCCKAHSKINRKMGNLTPCKIVTPKIST